MVWLCKVSELNLRKETQTHGMTQNKTVQLSTEGHQQERTKLPTNYRTVERQERWETLVPPTCIKQKKKSSIVNHCVVCISHVTNLITSKQSQYPLRLWEGFVSNKL